VPTSLRGIANRARESKHHRFRNLYGEVNVELLMHCWHDVNKDAASGVDRLTAEVYARNLEANITDLAERVKAKRYRAKLVRRVWIPKENGQQRPLGIPALEDKLVQLACATVLSAIYEQDFLDCSYGYRPGRSAKQAVIELARELERGPDHHVVEADIRGFFDHMDHDWVVKMLGERIDDRAFLGLIRKWLKAGILDTDGAVYEPGEGTPQGGIISPVLANIYLHYALDLWVERVVKPRCRGRVLMCRYADDFVCVFSSRADAERFYGALPKRLGKFALEVAPEKTQVVPFSRSRPDPSTRIVFLGFELYWHRTFKGPVRLRRRTARKRLQRAVRGITDWIKSHRHLPGKEFVKELNRRLIGHYNYYGLRGNASDLWRVYHAAVAAAYKWLNRRGGKRASFTREVFLRALTRLGAARPRITEQSIVQRELVLV
jgi:RNA-directed DNA polymerase